MKSSDVTKPRASAAGALIEAVTQATIDKSVADLKEAEELLAAKLLKKYLVTYRLASKKPTPKGVYSQRRAHLLALIKALSGKAHHVSTSVWIVKSRHETPDLVCSLLARALDLKIDLVGVDHVGATATCGHHDLED